MLDDNVLRSHTFHKAGASRLMFFGAFPPVALSRLPGATVLVEVCFVNALISRCSGGARADPG
jgi:hypothetical protein